MAQFLKAENADMSQFSQVTRLDTATPNWKHLAEDGVIRANVDRIWSPSGEDRLGGDITDAFVQDKRTGQSYSTFNFTYGGNRSFQQENARMIEQAKNGEYWINNQSGDLWRRTTAYVESEKQAEIDRLARIALKQKYGIT